MRRFGSGIRMAPAAWLGLVWVYSGALWLAAVWLGWVNGHGELALLAFVRSMATVTIGVAICGTERWGWAAAVTLSAIYLLFGAGVSALVGTALSQRPAGFLSWQPVLWGLTSAQCVRLLQASATVTVATLATILCLWRARSHFDVPDGRLYGTIVSYGLVPTLVILLLDGLLILGWTRS